jgi:hypothetical protein
MSMTTLDWMVVSRYWWSSTYWDINKSGDSELVLTSPIRGTELGSSKYIIEMTDENSHQPAPCLGD